MQEGLVCRIVKTASLALIFFLALGAYAQTAQTGALSGVVTDPTGSVLPGAGITVTSASSGQPRTATTEDNGRFLVPLLPPGSYKVEVSHQGFKMTLFTCKSMSRKRQP